MKSIAKKLFPSLFDKTTLKKKSLYITLFFGFLFSFYIFSIPVKEDILRGLDFNMTVRLQDNTPLRIDPLFSFFSLLGNFETTSIILLGILFLSQIGKIRLPKDASFVRKLFEFIKHPAAGLVIYFIFGFAHVVEVIGKLFLDHEGPPHMFLRTKTVDFPQFYIHTPGSYPSGHSMRMIFIMIVVTFILFSFKKLPQFVKFSVFSFLLAYSAIMLYSRVSLGEHWTTDVIGGSMLGASFGFLALVFL